LKKISPVAWRHINLRGNFKFKKGLPVDLNEIIKSLLKITGSEYSVENTVILGAVQKDPIFPYT